LTQPFDSSGRGAWTLLFVVAAIAALIGKPLGEALLTPHTRRTGDPLAAIRSREPGLRVLFIGNSFTYFHSMPTMIEQLAAGNPQMPRRVLVYQYAPGGSHLADAARDPALVRLVTSVRWNIIVLQEQSQVPALPYWLSNESLPAVRSLTSLIRRDGALPVLFETWGYQRGDLENFGSDSYPAMQERLHDGYADLAQGQRITIVPVGDTWSTALAERPSLPLWDTDGHHPSLEGSYLTAAVFNTAFDLLDRKSHVRDPALSTYTAGLDPRTAEWLRQVAAGAVPQALASDDY
jgi:hypothetical protein